ncbi:MAG: hypothetical protein CFE49_13525 [Pseudomonas sp. PGPPP3]|nr:MAG: hypothetical protein CFE49_13525 [Pseudomonas sp. PGPPP3]
MRLVGQRRGPRAHRHRAEEGLSPVRPIPLFDCRVADAVSAAAVAVLASGQLAAGRNVAALEEAFSLRLTGRPVVSMSDMTHALTMALSLAGVAAGDEVLTLSFNCLSSNGAIAQLGARPVWLDIDPQTASVSLQACAAALTSRTRALMVYHVAGYPAPMRALRQFCRDHGLALIEDANNALGALIDGQPTGTFGDFAVFSLYANRQVNAVEGAMLVCPDADTASRASQLRRFGIPASRFRDALGEIDPDCDVPQIGMSSALTNVNASLGLAHLPSLDSRLARNRTNVQVLTDQLQDLSALRPVQPLAGNEPAYWVWLVHCDRRDEVLDQLKRAGVQCSKLHQPNHVYSGFAAAPRDLPGTAEFMQSVLALPCGWWLDDDDLTALAGSVRTALTA